MVEPNSRGWVGWVAPPAATGHERADAGATCVQDSAAAETRIAGAEPFVLRLGEPSAALAAFHERHGVRCSAFVSAWIAPGEGLRAGENARRHAALGRDLARQGLPLLEGQSQPSADREAGRPGYLIAGLPMSQALGLGRRLGQHAIVWCADDAVPQRMILR